jgi:uncharacterized protein (DUF924 family)
MGHAGSDEILDFWFGQLDEHGCADPEHAARWWKKDAAFDEEIRRRFGELHRAIAARELDDWLTTPRGRLAQIVALDQFSRNMFRDSPAMFAGDARALELAREGLERGDDRALGLDERLFMLMPLVHSEDIADQDHAVRLVEALRDAAPASARERAAAALRFAGMHRDIVRRFGRFPHRNALLGRASSEEEIAFLQQPGSRF